MTDNISVTEGSGKTVATDDVGGVQYQVIKPAFGTDGVATVVSSTDPLPVTLSSITGSIGVYFDRANPSVNVGTPTIAAITASVGVYFDRGNPSVTVANGSGGSAVPIQDGGNTITVDGTLTGITGSVAVYFDRGNPTVTEVSGATIATNTGSAVTALQIIDDWDESDRAKVNPIVGQAGIAAGSGVAGALTTRVVHVTDVGSSVQLMAGTNLVGIVGVQSTASLFTASGTAATLGNNTIIAPSANASFKVYAYSLQTTGAVSIAARFTTGAATGATELWRPLATASGVTGVQGAVMATRPGAPIFVTGTSTTLSLWLDSATTVHYSVAYTKESA